MGHSAHKPSVPSDAGKSQLNSYQRYEAMRNKIQAEASGQLIEMCRLLGGGSTIVFMGCPGLDVERFVDKFCKITSLVHQVPQRDDLTREPTYVPQWPLKDTTQVQEPVSICTALLARSVLQHLPRNPNHGKVPRVFSNSALEIVNVYVPTAMSMCARSATPLEVTNWSLWQLGQTALSTMKIDLDITRTLFVYLRLDDKAAWAQMCATRGIATAESAFVPSCRRAMDELFYQVSSERTEVIDTYHTCVVHVHTPNVLTDEFVWLVAHIISSHILALHKTNRWGSANQAEVLSSTEYRLNRCLDTIALDERTQEAHASLVPAASVPPPRSQ